MVGLSAEFPLSSPHGGDHPAGALKHMLIGLSSPRVRRSPDFVALDHDGAICFSAGAEISPYFYVGSGGRPVSSLQGGGPPAIPGISAFRCLSSPRVRRSPLPGGLIQ